MLQYFIKLYYFCSNLFLDDNTKSGDKFLRSLYLSKKHYMQHKWQPRTLMKYLDNRASFMLSTVDVNKVKLLLLLISCDDSEKLEVMKYIWSKQYDCLIGYKSKES